MAAIYCPTCKIPIGDSTADNRFECPKCGRVYRSQNPVPSPPTPPIPSTVPTPKAADSPPAIQIQTTPPKQEESRPATFVSHPRAPKEPWLIRVIDPNFQRYAAPLVVKIIWVAVLIFAIFALLFCLGAALLLSVSILGSDLEFGDKLTGIAWVALVLFVQFIGISFFILVCRLSLETIIVIFDIADSLRTIRSRGDEM